MGARIRLSRLGASQRHFLLTIDWSLHLDNEIDHQVNWGGGVTSWGRDVMVTSGSLSI